MRRLPLLVLLPLALGSCAMPEARSLDGRPLYRGALDPDERMVRVARLENASAWRSLNEGESTATIWQGRRLAYLSRYRDAVDVYSEGIRVHPDNPRLYRHRGHRYITLRKLDLARRDLERARHLIFRTKDEVEPDGLPNARNIPTSTLHFNIWYHLGLVHYLRGDLLRARWCYFECLRVAKNPDALCATTHWLHMTLRRMGDKKNAQEVLAPIRDSLDVIENRAYHRLCLLYRGELTERDIAGDAGSIQGATAAYGVANWHLAHGRKKLARRLMREIVDGGQWAAFGYIAAEADLANEALWR